MKRYSSDWYWFYVINYSLVIIIIFPIYWTFISSIKKPSELITSDPTFFPRSATSEYYDRIWNYGVRDSILVNKDDKDLKNNPDEEGVTVDRNYQYAAITNFRWRKIHSYNY